MTELVNILKWLMLLFVVSFFMRPYLRVRKLKLPDSGFALSLGLGTALSFYLAWILSAIGLYPFDEHCLITFVCLALLPMGVLLIGVLLPTLKTGRGQGLAGARAESRKRKASDGHAWTDAFTAYLADFEWKRFLIGFALFAVLFVVIVWIRGFKSDLNCQTEQYMDFGFVNAIYRQRCAVPEDIWFGGKQLNYYYLGQACTVYLCRLSGVTPAYGYTFMLATIFAAVACMILSLVYAILCRILPENRSGNTDETVDENKKDNGNVNGNVNGNDNGNRKRICIPALCGGVTALLMSCFAGNGHYLYYGIIIPILEKITGKSLSYRPEGYFFPDSTVYIGYYPETDDRGKNEFLSYSVILGDLHAHMINLLFVVPLLALAIDYALDDEKQRFLKRLFDVRLVLVSILLSLYMGCNYWDLPIYFVICGALVLFHDLAVYATARSSRSGKGSHWVAGKKDAHTNSAAGKKDAHTNSTAGKKDAHTTSAAGWKSVFLMIGEVLLKGAWMFGFAKLLAIPFETGFVKMMSGIRICQNHSPLYKFLLLWGIPYLIAGVLLIKVLTNLVNQKKKLAALMLLVLILCAAGLTLMPEVIYVQDIYGETYARFNTMFKLTYQAFLLFGIVTGLAAGIFLADGKKKIAIPVMCLVLLLSGFFVTGVHQFMGNVLDAGEREGADVCDFLLKDPELYAEMNAIHLINSDPREKVRILEVGGDSYSPDNKVSVFTGACTYVGWSVHEWMWRGDWDSVGMRGGEVRFFYEAGDENYCKNFLAENGIDYVFAGPREYTKYAVYEAGFAPLCEEVFRSEEGYCLYRVR
ncbi:MAG: hypothetical protein J5518_04450 [Lachnospiraceae bacterium]|nr:hypothetical protein [Lachnospiraceae bacterium]